MDVPWDSSRQGQDAGSGVGVSFVIPVYEPWMSLIIDEGRMADKLFDISREHHGSHTAQHFCTSDDGIFGHHSRHGGREHVRSLPNSSNHRTKHFTRLTTLS